jgi:hypothetical protein
MKFIIGILLFPISILLIISLFNSLYNLTFFEKNQFLFLSGFISYILIHFLFYKPVFAYVMSHEISHALCAWLFGRKINEIKITSTEGYTSVENPNIFIALIPYLFPFYTILVLILILIAKEIFYPYLIFLLGATLSFHIIFTITAVLKRQSDFANQRIFSLSIIFFVNVIIIIVILSFIAYPNIKILDIMNNFYQNLKHVTSFFKQVSKRV